MKTRLGDDRVKGVQLSRENSFWTLDLRFWTFGLGLSLDKNLKNFNHFIDMDNMSVFAGALVTYFNYHYH